MKSAEHQTLPMQTQQTQRAERKLHLKNLIRNLEDR